MDSSITSYCCLISDKRLPSWNVTHAPVTSGPGLLSSTGFLSPQPPGVWSRSGPRNFASRLHNNRFSRPALWPALLFATHQPFHESSLPKQGPILRSRSRRARLHSRSKTGVNALMLGPCFHRDDDRHECEISGLPRLKRRALRSASRPCRPAPLRRLHRYFRRRIPGSAN
jgi:hypothetical protein